MTKSFRIKNSEPEHATIWPIGTGNHYHIHWEEANEDTTYTKQQVESALERGVWTKIEDEPSESLPRTFKFVLHPAWCDSKTYTYDGVNKKYLDPETGKWYELSQEYVKESIERGDYIVLPSEPEKNFIDTLQIKIALDGLDEAMKAVEELTEASNSLLQSIKTFTSGTGHDVWIAEGTYKVYRKGEDVPYICYTDEQLVAVMDALKTLDEAGKEGEGRFFTLNIKGIL